MEYTEEQLAEIMVKLLEIQTRPNLISEWGDVLPWDTFRITATYNKENPTMVIDGNLCEILLAT